MFVVQYQSQKPDLRIVLADPQRRVRAALKTLLNHQPGHQVLGEAANLESLENVLNFYAPDVLLIDPEILAISGQMDLKALCLKCPDISIIALSGKPEYQKICLEAGADVFVSKGDPPEHLLSAIQQFHH